MHALDIIRLALGLAAILFVSCGDPGNGTSDTDTGTDNSTDTATNGTSDTDNSIDTATAAEPCDYTNPTEVQLGVAVSAAAPSAACEGGAHFYRFTPAVAGTYSIVKTGGCQLGFCETSEGGCICAGDVNCCTDCTLTFDLPDGSDLPAGSNNEIYINGTVGPGPYTFTVTGPN